MSKKEEKDFDDFFRDSFENFENSSNKENWDAIYNKLNTKSFDQIVQNKMDKFEQVPPTSIWFKIKDKLPYHLVVRQYLHRLTKIAAVLTIGMLCYILYSKDPQKIQLAHFQIPQAEPLTPTIPSTEPSFVFELKDEKESIHSASSNFASDTDTSIDEMLSDIFADNAQLLKSIEQKKLDEILSPLFGDPIEGIIDEIFATTDSTKDVLANSIVPEQEDDLKIWVPIKFVEEHEIQAMLDAYDQGLEK